MGGTHERTTTPMGTPAAGHGDPLADREAGRDGSRGSGLIDPDEPTEGIRLLS
jgi:hypothetical protein